MPIHIYTLQTLIRDAARTRRDAGSSLIEKGQYYHRILQFLFLAGVTFGAYSESLKEFGFGEEEREKRGICLEGLGEL